jgi:hypothetical protein
MHASFYRRVTVGVALFAAAAVMNRTYTEPVPDVTPPTVVIRSPGLDEMVSGLVSLTADAADDTGVAAVRFYVDGIAVGVEDATVPFGVTLDTHLFQVGAHVLSAIARDQSGNVGDSDLVTVIFVPRATVPVNRPPSAVDDRLTTPAGTQLGVTPAALLANDSDADGDSLTVTITATATAGGAIAGNGAGGWTYTPRAGFTGLDSFRYAVADGRGGTASASVAVEVTPSMTLPPGWATTDIGAVGATGSATFSAGPPAFTVRGAGADVWGSADAFRFVHLPLAGDGDIVARVAAVQNVNAWTKAGVMIRSTLAPGSPHAAMFLTPGRGSAFQRRAATNGTSASTAGTVVAAPYWVRMTRRGNTFTAAQSADGVAWKTIGSQTITMPATVFAGLAVSSHVAGTLATSTFTNVGAGAAHTPSDTTPPTVTATPAGGSFATSQAVTLSASEPADIFFTSDGSTPTVNSPPYTGTLTFTGTTTLRFIARDTAGNISAPAAHTYTRTVSGGDTTAPVATAPVEAIDLSSLTSTTVPVRLTWSATDNQNGSGIARYEVQRSIGGATWTAETLSTPLTAGKTLSLKPGTEYGFRVRAVDVAGNVGNWAATSFKIAVLQENAEAVAYAGAWTTDAVTTASGAQQQFATAAGATSTFSFTGRSVAWVAVKATDRGRAEVFIDGVSAGIVNLYHTSTTAAARRVVFRHAFAAGGPHTIRVTVLGSKATASTGTRVDVDAFVISQ